MNGKQPWYVVVFGPLVTSRKAMSALIGAIASVVVTLGAKLGLDLDTATIVILVSPIVAGTVSYVFGTAWEDVAHKKVPTVTRRDANGTLLVSTPHEPRRYSGRAGDQSSREKPKLSHSGGGTTSSPAGETAANSDVS